MSNQEPLAHVYDSGEELVAEVYSPIVMGAFEGIDRFKVVRTKRGTFTDA